MNHKTLILLILLITGALTQINCMDPIRDKNRQRFKPADWFEGDYLPMAQAIYSGNTKEIERQVKEKGIDPNGMSPNGRTRFLLYACIMEDPKAVQKLLDLGADPNKVSPQRPLNRPANESQNATPVSFAVGRGNMEITKILLKHGANPNVPVGLLPLDKAMAHDNMQEYIDLLFRYGADANYQEYGDNKNIAQIALLGGKYGLIGYFLDKGTNPSLPDMDGSSLAFDIQEKLVDYRGTEEGRKMLEQLKDRLEKQYHIHFPVKRDYERGARLYIQRYAQLPAEIKSLYGMEESAEFRKKIQDSLAVGKTYWGLTIEEINNKTKETK